MPKRKTIFLENAYYHACNRGFRKEHIFKNPQDKKYFIHKSYFYAEKFNIIIESSAILVNHFHFLLIQNEETGIREFLTRLQLSYAIHYNNRYKRIGPVFGGRFNAKMVKDRWQYITAFNYILKNPWKHEMEYLTKLNDLSPGTKK